MSIEQQLLEHMELRISAINESKPVWNKPGDAYSVQRSDRNYGEDDHDHGSYKKPTVVRVYHLYINGVLWQKKDEGPVVFYTLDAATRAADKIRSRGKKVEIASSSKVK